jgi:hypothetical protein
LKTAANRNLKSGFLPGTRNPGAKDARGTGIRRRPYNVIAGQIVGTGLGVPPSMLGVT